MTFVTLPCLSASRLTCDSIRPNAAGLDKKRKFGRCPTSRATISERPSNAVPRSSGVFYFSNAIFPATLVGRQKAPRRRTVVNASFLRDRTTAIKSVTFSEHPEKTPPSAMPPRPAGAAAGLPNSRNAAALRSRGRSGQLLEDIIPSPPLRRLRSRPLPASSRRQNEGHGRHPLPRQRQRMRPFKRRQRIIEMIKSYPPASRARRNCSQSSPSSTAATFCPFRAWPAAFVVLTRPPGQNATQWRFLKYKMVRRGRTTPAGLNSCCECLRWPSSLTTAR